MTKKIGFHFKEKHVPWLLLIFTLAAYIPLATQMGFYWDDWPMLWFKVTQGAEGFAKAFTSDRPFLGNLYEFTAALLGNDPVVWQVITVLLRWTVTVAFWWMLKQLWPERKREVFWISMLLAVYPGFKQMPIVYVWLNAFIMLLAYVLSYGMMLKAISGGSKKKWILWTIPSVLLYTFCTISTEYYVGLDICRGVIIYIFLLRDAGFRELSFWKRIWKTLLQWLPYLAVLGAFMVWRVFIFQFPSYQPVLVGEFVSHPLKTVFDILNRIVEDAYTATWGAWTEFVKFPNHVDFETASGKAFWLIAVVTLAAAIIAALLYKPDAEKSAETEDGSEYKQTDTQWCVTALILGLLMVIFPGFPYWVTSLPIRLAYPYDRFLVAFMFGSSIFMVALIRWAVRAEWMRRAVYAVFVAMAVGGSFLNSNSYRKDWNMQKDFINQLVTRVPELEPNTILMADNNPLSYESDNSLTGEVNLALDPDHEGLDLPYSVLFFSSRFDTIENYEEMDTIYQEFRSAEFKADSEDVVVYYYAPPSCLRILDPEQHEEMLSTLPDSYRYFLKLSDTSRVITGGTAATFLQDEIFKEPIEQNWCYYFQKADLARQDEDWEAIAAIGDEVLSTMKAKDVSEYLIFIEAYMHLDRWEDAENLIRRVHDEQTTFDYTLCKYLHKWLADDTIDLPESGQPIMQLIQAMNYSGCSFSED